jgi:hypothetical protein
LDSGCQIVKPKLAQIKSQTGMDYRLIMASFTEALNQLPQLEGKVKSLYFKSSKNQDGICRKMPMK